MSILELIKGVFCVSPAKKAGETGSTTGEYIDWLPGYMLGVSVSQVMIDSSQPLPGANRYPDDAPVAAAVVNRLKILSGLSPIQYDAPREGHFTQKSGNYKVSIKTTFIDKDGKSRCSLVISVRAQ